jgi:flagellar biosynthesis/type III secretory pathway ATPase
MEFLTQTKVDKDSVVDTVMEEFSSYDSDLRVLTYKILLEKFNSKYSTLNIDQKRILREYINSVDSTSTLMEFYNSEVSNLKDIFEKSIPNISDKALVIKLNEVKKFLTPISKTQKVTGENLVDLLQFYSLTNKLN